MRVFQGAPARALRLPVALLLFGGLAACGGGGGDGGGTAASVATCSDFSFQEDAQDALRAGATQLDADNDGVACETLPHRPAPGAALVEGLFTGTISGSSVASAFQMLSLENGDVWALYGNQSGSTFLVDGFVQGSTSRSGSTVTSSDVKDFGFNPAPAGTFSGSLTSTAVSGTLNFNGQQVSIAGGPAASTTYNYDQAANLAQITGSWSLRGIDGTTTNVSINSSGGFAGTNGSCAISGTIRPRASGKNVFDVSVTSGPAPCVAPGSVSTGIAVTYLLAGSTSRELVVAGVNSTRTAGNAFFGVR